MKKESYIILILFIISLFLLKNGSCPESVKYNQMQESNIKESEKTILLWTDDGLKLSLNRSDGSMKCIQLGDHTLASGGFMIRFEEVLENSNILKLHNKWNPLEWGMSQSFIVQDANGHIGSWLKLNGADGIKPRRTFYLDQKEPLPVILSGWCQASVKGDAFGWWNRNLAINATGVYDDGTSIPEQSAYFGQYNHGPQFNRRVICPDHPISRLEVKLSVPPGECKAWYRDVDLYVADYGMSSPSSMLERVDNAVLQEFNLEKAKLRGKTIYKPHQDCIEVECRIESMISADRAISAFLALPIDSIGGLWHDDVRNDRRIESGRFYRDAIWYGAGRDGYNNRYPLACIETSSGDGIVLAIPPDTPRVFQTSYDALRREFRIRYDLGLSSNAGTWANRSSFRAYLFRCKDGFRGALDRYQKIFPWAFNDRIQRHGLWLAFATPAHVPGGWEDFRFQFLESVSHMGFAEQEGMLSLRYSEPWIHHQAFPPGIYLSPEIQGIIDPQKSLDLAQRISSQTNSSFPLDIRRRFASYLGSFIEDKWGQPQGYFFRSSSGGRNENMMIVNPNDRLPPPKGTDYSSGGWDREIIDGAMETQRQWHIEGWTFLRVDIHPFLHIDEKHKFAGKKSLRLDPVQSQSYYEQYLRGINQMISLKESPLAAPLKLSFNARAENLPSEGIGGNWRITLWHEDGSNTSHSFPLSGLSDNWNSFSNIVPVTSPTIAVNLSLEFPVYRFDPTIVWVDEVGLTLKGDKAKNFVVNGGFEKADLVPCRLDGVYLDTMECYECNLNYRRDHWNFTEDPLTFDTGRHPAMHQIFSHITFARHIAEELRPRGLVLFGNCVPRTPFAAPLLDILGTEIYWKQDSRLRPWPDSEFNFARFMAGPKPYCILQYSNLTAEEQELYIKRCLFYGALPSNQGAPGGGWYWIHPIAVERHREVFVRYLPIILTLSEAGWQPLTLAKCKDNLLWMERFGNEDHIYFTVFNPGRSPVSTSIILDPRCMFGSVSMVEDILNGNRVVEWYRSVDGNPSFKVNLKPADVCVYRVSRQQQLSK